MCFASIGLSLLLSNVFIVIYLVFALFWDSRDSTLIGHTLRSMVRPFVVHSGLSYRWNMYSGPFTHLLEIEVRVRYRDGTTMVIALPPRYEFRRYCFMLGRERNPFQFEVFADYTESRLVRNASQAIEIAVVRRSATVPLRPCGFWGHFDVGTGPQFDETVVHKRLLQ